MSTLIPIPRVWPSTLLVASEVDQPRRDWSVLYLKARQEKAMARDLFSRQTPYYLPTVKKTSVYGKRRLTSYLPMFPGYLFLFATEAESLQALETKRIARVLKVSDQTCLHRDLIQLEQAIASGAPMTIESRLTVGHCVRIRQGPLAGLEGVVLVRRGLTRLVISVNFLQQGASVVVDDHLLERID